jgi:hypothetical protein
VFVLYGFIYLDSKNGWLLRISGLVYNKIKAQNHG